MRKFILLIVVVLLCACSKSDDNPVPPPTEEETLNTAPTVAVKVYPTNGLLCTENPLEFRWNSATDKEGDAITYEIEVASDAAFTNIIEKASVNGTNKTITLEKGIEVHWRVRAKDSKNEYGDYSPYWTFYTEGEGITNYLPFTPTPLHPILNTKVSGSSVILEWSSTDVDGDPLVYDVYFGPTTPPIIVKEDNMEATYEVNIEMEQTYYWQIIVKDGKGGESVGDIWKFKS